jgi:hypothetical protein
MGESNGGYARTIGAVEDFRVSQERNSSRIGDSEPRKLAELQRQPSVGRGRILRCSWSRIG